MTWNKFVLLFLIVISFSLRSSHLSWHAPFDWDQDRDYAQVEEIADGKVVILGPIAKGVGGFYLGSLYYYLLYPAYALLQGDLIALPLTSVVLDSLMVGLSYLLLVSLVGRKIALAITLLWAFSPFFISASYVSWNVSLVPLWSLLTLYSFWQIITNHSRRYLYLLAGLAGLSFHVHVSAIPLIPLIVLFFRRSFSYSPRIYLRALFMFLLPLLPMLYYDLTHNWFNFRLFYFQLRTQASVATPLWDMVTMTTLKLGKVGSGIILARFADNLLLGIMLLTLALKNIWFDRRVLLRLASTTLILSTLLIITLRDYTFPEYYFAASYLSLLVIVLFFLSDILAIFKSRTTLAFAILLSLALVFNYRANSSITESGFSLGAKQALVSTLSEFDEPLDLHYDFIPGREGGFSYLVRNQGIQLDPHSPLRVLLTDRLDTPLYIEGELTHDLHQIGNFKSARYIVQ